jgi:hypothetical protein
MRILSYGYASMPVKLNKEKKKALEEVSEIIKNTHKGAV